MEHCGYITQQTAEAVCGGHLNPSREMGVGCMYTLDGHDEKGVLVSVSPPLETAVGMTEMTLYNEMLHSDATAPIVPVSGLGDKANFVTSKDGSMVTLEVLYHSPVAAIGASYSNNRNLKAALTQAMRQMMQKC